MLVVTLLFFFFLLGCGGKAQEPVEEGESERVQVQVPDEFQDLYSELENKLSEIDDFIASRWKGEEYPTALCANLLIANSHRGEALLYSETYRATLQTLDRLQSLGVKGVSLSIGYPIFRLNFPHAAEYIDFYQRLAAEIRGRGLILNVETGTTFRSPVWSSLNVEYSGLTLEQYKREKRQMVETIIQKLRPDYLTVENEPLTQQANTGLKFTVENQTEIVKYILKGLDRSGVKIGAGAGNWDNLAYFQSLARNTNIDYIDVHIYPIQGDFVMDKMEKVAQIARSRNKGLAIGEAWLYKLSSEELPASPGREEVFYARDVYSFWAPLDSKFIETMAKLSSYLQLEYCSFFWMRYLYAYLDYDQSTSGLEPREAFKEVDRLSYRNILTGILTDTGKALKRLLE